MTYPLLAGQFLLMTVFSLAVVGKLRSRLAWVGFVDSIRGMRLARGGAAPLVAAGTVTAEAVTVPLLAVPATVPIGLLLAGFLLVLFTVAVSRSLRRGVRTACHCFGRSEAPLGRSHLVRNAVLLAVVAVCGVAVVAGPASPHPAGLALAAFTGMVLAALLVNLEQIVDLFASSSPELRSR